MKKTSAVKEIAENYQDDQGENPLFAALNLFTFAKTIPWQLFKAIGLTALLIGGMLFSLFYLGASWLLIITGVIASFFLLIFLPLSASVAFIGGSFLTNVEEMLMSLLSPIDQMYDAWQSTSDKKMSRQEFAQIIFNEIIFPRLTNYVPSIFMGASINKKLSEVEGSFQDLDSDDNLDTLDTLVASIPPKFAHIRHQTYRPFRWVLFLFLIVWGVLLLLHVQSLI